MKSHDNESDEEIIYVSKSEMKREMHALQALGEELVKLPGDQFDTLDLPDDLRDAIAEARRMHQRGALKRQLQYIGRLMRSVDADPIREQLDTLRGQSRRASQELHRIERWRERLLKEGDSALTELVDDHPDIDRNYLRQLIRNAKKEMLDNKAPRSSRALFRYLREFLTD
jgi:ribosome-associated protein